VLENRTLGESYLFSSCSFVTGKLNQVEDYEAEVTCRIYRGDGYAK